MLQEIVKLAHNLIYITNKEQDVFARPKTLMKLLSKDVCLAFHQVFGIHKPDLVSHVQHLSYTIKVYLNVYALKILRIFPLTKYAWIVKRHPFGINRKKLVFIARKHLFSTLPVTDAFALQISLISLMILSVFFAHSLLSGTNKKDSAMFAPKLLFTMLHSKNVCVLLTILT